MEIFAISPASPRPLWFLAVICLLIAIVFVALVFTAWSSRSSRVEIETDRIRLVGDFWGREIPIGKLNIAGARILDITGKSDYSLKRRTLGTGLPGYASGWFRLRNGEKALVYLSRRHDVVYLPTSDGYSLLLSVDEPHGLIERLQHHSGSDPDITP